MTIRQCFIQPQGGSAETRLSPESSHWYTTVSSLLAIILEHVFGLNPIKTVANQADVSRLAWCRGGFGRRGWWTLTLYQRGKAPLSARPGRSTRRCWYPRKDRAKQSWPTRCCRTTGRNSWHRRSHWSQLERNERERDIQKHTRERPMKSFCFRRIHVGSGWGAIHVTH